MGATIDVDKAREGLVCLVKGNRVCVKSVRPIHRLSLAVSNPCCEKGRCQRFSRVKELSIHDVTGLYLIVRNPVTNLAMRL